MAATSQSDHARPRVGISRCLLGDEVRHDGGHKRDRYATDVLAAYVDWVPVCPEVEVGMTTPRPALRLVRGPRALHMITIKTGEDWTDRMNAYSGERVEELEDDGLAGFVLKKNSPSCGMERVKVYDDNGVPARDGSGLFATALLAKFPSLPVEEEGRLNDHRLRECFVTRIFAYQRWRQFLGNDPTPAGLVRFHTAHKYLLLAHSPKRYYELGPQVARAGEAEFHELLASYESGFMAALARPAPAKRHVNVLQHLCGFLKDELDAATRAELGDVIESFRDGVVPLIAPLTLLNHHLRRLDHPWVGEQRYLDPYPRELALRSVI
jgi:uncharacterized protein YbgA (DUF1722 family)/uncharacterized protein YbbK (DUF523 family)